MKTLVILFVAIINSQFLFSQIIVSNTSVTVPCCNYEDSLDFNSDLLYDFNLNSTTYGTFTGFKLNSGQSIILSDNIVSSGNSFGFKEEFHQQYLANYGQQWWYSWDPDGTKYYIGFAKINTSIDTTFGWLELKFSGNGNLMDTFYITKYAYNIISNERIDANEITLSTPNIKEPEFLVYPNPTTSGIFITSPAKLNSVSLLDATGKLISVFSEANSETLSLDLKNYETGIYFVKAETEDGSYLVKVVRE